MREDNLYKYKELKRQKYLIIPSFLKKEELNFLEKKIDEKINSVPKGDSDVDNCRSIYNYAPFVQLLCDKRLEISNILGVNILPTYCYLRRYYNGSSLKKHLDRPACEISISVHLSGDKSWPLLIQNSPQDISITLNSGDAVLYWGHDDVHWREIYDGKSYTNAFFHYVRTYGKNFKNAFDIKETLNMYDNFIQFYNRKPLDIPYISV